MRIMWSCVSLSRNVLLSRISVLFTSKGAIYVMRTSGEKLNVGRLNMSYPSPMPNIGFTSLFICTLLFMLSLRGNGLR